MPADPKARVEAIAIAGRLPAGLTATRLRRAVTHWRRKLRAPAGQLSIVCVSPATMRRLNRHWRKRDKPTNVLSFKLATAVAQDIGERQWGEIILCPAVIRREAANYRRTPVTHTLALTKHGLIHLMGYDHETAADQRRWNRIETRLKQSS